MSDLDSVTTKELIDELDKRSYALVLGMDPLADEGVFRTRQNGSRLACAGLVRTLQLDSDQQLTKARDGSTPEPE